jgi:ligand-binding sensor domain-containing protein
MNRLLFRLSLNLIMMLLASSQIFAQWEECNNGLFGGNVTDLIISKKNIFAGTKYGVFLSTDNGDSWTKKNSGLTNSEVYSFAISGNRIFAGTLGGVFLSTDNGNSWSEKNSGLSYTHVCLFISYKRK